MVGAVYLFLMLVAPFGPMDSASAALARTAVLAAGFSLPPLAVLLAAGRRRRLAGGWPGPAGLWLAPGALSRDLIAGVVLGGLLALMNGISIQRWIREIPGCPTEQLSRLAWSSSAIGEVSLLLVAVGVVAPAAEEVFFRGVIYPALRKVLPVVPAVVLSSAAFGAAHLQSRWMHAFLLGLVAALLVEFTGSLVPAALAHMGVNIGFVIFLANRGLLAEAAPLWGLAAAFVLMNVLFFLLGQPLFGSPGASEAGAKPGPTSDEPP